MSHFITLIAVPKRVFEELPEFSLKSKITENVKTYITDKMERYFEGKNTSKPRWDWYVIGGRWDGFLRNAEPLTLDNGFNFGDEHHTLIWNSCKVKDFKPKYQHHAFVDKRGTWFESGEMGWFGSVSKEKTTKAWKTEMNGILSKMDKEDFLVCLDCHI